MRIEDWLGKDNKLGIDIWYKKNQYKNETFDEWLDRVSGGNAELRQLIAEKKFLFGGRTLANRGTNKKGSCSNCYSRGFVEDNLDDILQANTDIGKTFKFQGGQGISLSKIRPKGCGINNDQFVSDGIIPFMQLYNCTTASISQGGSRKGALILSLDIWHKEAEDFITIKSDKGQIEKANLSLEIDNEFMDCIKTYYNTGEVITKHISRDYEGNKIEYDVTPINLYKLMMKNAYDWGEPGCIFTDRFRNYNLMEYDTEYKIESCNPCGEQPLPKHGACNLGSINLSEFVINPFTKDAYFDKTNFMLAVATAVEALDTVLDENMNNHPLKEQKEMTYNYRNIGLGIMGLHDCLIKLGILYGSDESKIFIDDIMNLMFRTAVVASADLAASKGTFPKYTDAVLDSTIIKNHFSEEELIRFGIRAHGLRNCSLLSIAPTGSIGTMLNVSTGCEPLFQISYSRKTESLQNKDQCYEIYSKIASEYIKNSGNKDLPKYFNTSADIKWKDRIDIQSILQKHVDTAISSTVNLPQDITQEEIEQLYLYAWEKGLKGVTIFRSGCKRDAILNTKQVNSKEEELKEDKKIIFNSIVPITRDELGKKLSGTTYIENTACGKLYITINHDSDNNIVEVFVDPSKSGGCSANADCLGRYASAALRGGMSINSVIDITKGVKCAACTRVKGSGLKPIDGLSCGDIIARTIQEEYETLNGKIPTIKAPVKKQQEHNIKQTNTSSDNLCPQCNQPLIHSGGCVSCINCDYSKCD